MGKNKKKRAEASGEEKANSDEGPTEQLPNGDSSSHEEKKMKKKKRKSERNEQANSDEAPTNQFPSGDSSSHEDKKTKRKKSKRENNEEQEIPTVSIAVPGSIIDNAQSLELATRLAGQIARAATIFRIDEVVVFDNKSTSLNNEDPTMGSDLGETESGAAFLIRILRYLETPQYLRKALFPKHNSLRFVGLLPPLDAPHHLRKHEWASFREGVSLAGGVSESNRTLVDVGLSKNVVVDQVLEPRKRVTVAMGTNRKHDDDLPRQVVSASKPGKEAGMYWGYRVRYAPCLSSAFQDCPYKGGYDCLIGTSEHGLRINASKLSLPTFRHLLIAFGGLAGLEECVEEDINLKGKDVRELFHSYLNTCPHQGSRTIRTEEAIFISLQYFQEPIDQALGKVRYES